MTKQFDVIIKSPELAGISIDLVDRVIDNSISNNIVDNFPVVKECFSFIKLGRSISDYFFVKKSMNVLLELKDVDWKERTDFTNDLKDKDCSGAEKILLAIDKLETYEKCKVYGRLCKLKAYNKISVDEFKRMTKLIQDAYISDLALVPKFVEQIKENELKKKSFLYSQDYNEVSMEDYYPLLGLGLIYQDQDEQIPIELVESSDYKDLSSPYYRGGETPVLFFLSSIGTMFL